MGMKREPQYWLLSPNVKNEPQSVDAWKERIMGSHFAIIGERDGREPWDLRFVNEVQKGDIILVGRRSEGNPDVLAYGMVDGPCTSRRHDGELVFCRLLKPFKLWKVEPPAVRLLDILPRNRTLTQLHPDEYESHKTLCDWMKMRLEAETASAVSAKSSKYGHGGESSDHKKLKEWCSNHPEQLGLSDVLEVPGEMEYPPCGENTNDLADVFFTMPGGRYAVIEVETSNALPGAYQALKYKTLLCAHLGYLVTDNRVKAKLVAWEIPDEVRDFCDQYGIDCHEQRV